MIITAENEQLDRTKAQQLVYTVPLIPEVESIDVELYTDHSGDPAFQLTFRLRRDITVDDEFMDRFIAFAGQVQTAILHSDLNRFPYTRLERAA